ncbi:MAG: hypothetical protein HY758_03285 [Nitrospirae bacterium]|nr:hypothetical protein [Nitrospirota bacterium]
MKKTVIEIYAMAVCFVAVVCLVISLGIGLYDIMEISNPAFTISSYEYKKHQSNESFIKGDCGNEKETFADKKILTDEEITRQRLASFQNLIAIERRDAFQSLTIVAIILILDIILFFIHWRIAKRARNNGTI